MRVRLDRASEGLSDQRPDTVLLAFHGELRVGEDVARYVQRTLLSGTIRVVERALISDQRYVVAEATLDSGDAVIWHGANPVEPVDVWGFIQAGEGDALHVVGNAAAEYLSVQRLGTPPYQVKASAWDRIVHDPLLSIPGVIVAGGAALATLLDLLERWIGYLRYRPRASQRSAE